MLSREEVLKIAKLARLSLTDAEVALYQKRLGRVLEHVGELSKLAATADGFVRHVPKDAVAFREDRAVPSQNVRALLENAPETEGNCFLLPAVMGNEE